MRDDFVTARTPLSLTLANGNPTPPVNTNTFSPSSGSSPGPVQPFVVAAAGDGAAGRSEGDDVANLIDGWDPNLFLYLGDVYDKGTYTEFVNWYGEGNAGWSRFRNITNPTQGNHENVGGLADGYDYYWDNIPWYYSYDAGGWHFVSLYVQDSSSFTSAQEQWLLTDLAASSEVCTIAYFHKPVAFAACIWVIDVEAFTTLSDERDDRVPVVGAPRPRQHMQP